MSDSRQAIQRRNEIERLLNRAGVLRPPHAGLFVLAAVCVVVGICSFGLGLVLHPDAAWAAALLNFVFWTGAAQGGVALSAVFHLVGARWGRVVERIASAFAVFLPLAVVLFPLFWFGRASLFPWLGMPHRSPWLHLGWLFARDFLALVVMATVSVWFLQIAVRRDREALDAWHTTGQFPPETLRYEWIGVSIEAPPHLLLRRLAAVVIGVFLVGYSLLSIDLVMSAVGDYRSSLFPVIYLSGAFYAALALIAIAAAAWRRSEGLAELLHSSYLLYLGHLVWNFALFQGYLWWSRYIIIWMVNFPQEAGYHLTRWVLRPWSVLGWTAVACAVIIPGVLLFSRGMKRSDTALPIISGIGLLGILLEQALELLPALGWDWGPVAWLILLGVTVGFVGLAVLPYLWLKRRVPLFPVSDPLFREALLTRGVRV